MRTRGCWPSVLGMKAAWVRHLTLPYPPPPPDAHRRFLGKPWERSRVHRACFGVLGAGGCSSCSSSSCGDLSTTTSMSTGFLVLLGEVSPCLEGTSTVGACLSIIPRYFFRDSLHLYQPSTVRKGRESTALSVCRAPPCHKNAGESHAFPSEPGMFCGKGVTVEVLMCENTKL